MLTYRLAGFGEGNKLDRKDIVLIGAGGLGREVMWQLSEVNRRTREYNILGFVSDSNELQGTIINGFPVLGNDEWLINYPKKLCAVICIGSSKTRKSIFSKIRNNPLISFPTIIANDAQYSDSVTFGQGCVICLSNVLTVNIKIGDFVFANLDCTVGHDAVLEDFVTLNPSVNISGNVHIEVCAEIGTGVNIIQGKRVGENSIVGAGSVVARDIPANCTAVGVPAVPIKFHK